MEIMSVPMQNTIGTAWMETASRSFHTPESDSSRPAVRLSVTGKVRRPPHTYCHPLKQTVDWQRQDYQEASQGCQDLLLAPFPLSVGLGLRLQGAGVWVWAVWLGDTVHIALLPGLSLRLVSLHHIASVVHALSALLRGKHYHLYPLNV